MFYFFLQIPCRHGKIWNQVKAPSLTASNCFVRSIVEGRNVDSVYFRYCASLWCLERSVEYTSAVGVID